MLGLRRLPVERSRVASAIGGHEHIRLRSPYGLSMRPTLGQCLLRADERQRKRRLLARVRVRPLVGRDRAGRVRRVLQDVVLRIGLAVDDRLDLARGSRSSRRRSDRARPSLRSRSARPSACRRPETTPSARGSRSPSAASRRRASSMPLACFSGRRSKIISCATRPFVRV